ncbi:unnamed protein product, partial [Rotaria sp. Silwood2]
GTTLESNDELKRKYKPTELHFPSVAKRLNWNELLIIDWMDINPHSQEYSFLKELDVREVPDVHNLIIRIDVEHNNGSKLKTDYQLPKSLVFFCRTF